MSAHGLRSGVLSRRCSEPELSTRYFRGRKVSLDLMTRVNRIVLALPYVVLALAGCSGPTRPEISVRPVSIAVDVGSTTTFTVVFFPSRPRGSSLAWQVIPSNGGTISSQGVYTAPEKPGNYTVEAIWTSASGGLLANASASVEVNPLPQADVVLNPDMAQASGRAQSNGAIQNGVVVGQAVPLVISTDPSRNVQVGNGFTPPITCTDCDVVF